MGLRNHSRGAQRGIGAAADRASDAVVAANREYHATGQQDGPAARRANRAGDDLAALRQTRRQRGRGAQ
jgi:hypothetical protein